MMSASAIRSLSREAAEEAVSTAEEVAGRFDDEEDEITIDDALALLEDAVSSLETP